MQPLAPLKGNTALLNHYVMSEDDYLAREADCQGVCLNCRAWADGVDPGAAAAKCPSCGARDVHGIDQALLLGFIRIRR